MHKLTSADMHKGVPTALFHGFRRSVCSGMMWEQCVVYCWVCPCGSMEERLTTDQAVAGSSPATDAFLRAHEGPPPLAAEKCNRRESNPGRWLGGPES